MSPPPIAPFPPANIQQALLPEEWEACLDAWLALAQIHLRLPDSEFLKTTDDEGPLVSFLVSYYRELTRAPNTYLGSKDLSLKRECFLLAHRALSAESIPSSLLQWAFLSDLCHAYPRSKSLRALFQGIWKRKGDYIEGAMHKIKLALTKALDSGNPASVENDLGRLCHLLHVSHDAGLLFITGSDFLDSLCVAYSKTAPSLQSKLVTVAYLSLVSLIKSPKPNYSLLSDHLYSLKTSAELEKSKSGKKLLLADLVTNTPFLSIIKDGVSQQKGARARNIADSLSAFRQAGLARPKKLVRRKVDKGKGRADDDEYGHGAFGGVYIYRMSLVSQVQDLFPDLGAGFVVKLLDEYNDDVEQVTAHLLDDSLPSYLKNADRTEHIAGTNAPGEVLHLTPRSTPPPQRRNVFDNDEFDQLTVDASRLHIGRKNERLTADAILSDRTTAPNKAAILSALAAFDSNDDERDDTYDAEDVGGTVDSAMPGSDEVDADLRDRNEEALFKAYTGSPEAFGRDAATRRSKVRAVLRSETGMTDEAIEGWAIMIGRDPRRLRRLEAKFSTFSGQQRELAPTAYRSSPADSGAEAEGSGADVGGDGRGGRGGEYRGRGRGRGRGGRGGGPGGNVTGPSDDKATQASRQRKEAHKGSRANHNRRDQRARKMARGGFPG